MKKTIIFLSLFMSLSLAMNAMAQVKTLSEKIEPGSIKHINVKANSHLVWVHDTACYMQISWDESDYTPQGYGMSVSKQELNLNDESGKLNYELHLDTNLNVTWSLEDDATITLANGERVRTVNGDDETLRSVANELKGLIDELVDTFDSIYSGRNSDMSNIKPKAFKKNKRKYSVSDRTDFKFHWAFTNWGDSWNNGLMKMDGAYNLRTSFSSYQLSENYAIVMTEHTKLSVGIGYESDVYKFTNNYVSMDNTGNLYTVDQTSLDAQSGVNGTSLGNWSSRLVTRYVTLPVEFEYRDKGLLKSFRMSLGVIPGICFNTSHTGLKHELEQPGRNFQDVDDISKYMNPFKMDVRLSFKLRLIGLFIQVPTVPVFIDSATKVYPIKLGFVF